jgi:hypothetical protein
MFLGRVNTWVPKAILLQLGLQRRRLLLCGPVG